jgi:UDP-N-acetylmuramate dehydrogenase
LKKTRFVWVESQAGESGMNLYCGLSIKIFGGLENMSLIPGNVGTTPVKTLVHGTEIKTLCFLRGNGNRKSRYENVHKDECHFGYRESVLKTKQKNQYIITSVVLN